MFGRGGNELDHLIAKKKYAKALKVLRSRLEEQPENDFLRNQMADVLIRKGDSAEALRVLETLADRYATRGFLSKAIAVLKKIQRIDPDNRAIEERIARMVSDGSEERVAPGEGVIPLSASPDPVPEESELHEIEIVVEEDAALELPEEEDDEDTYLAEGAARSPLFEDFSREELLAVIRGLILHSFEAGEIVCTEGEPGTSMYLLASGSLRVYVRNGRGHNNQVRLLRAGTFFGEISLISKEPRSATITCAEPCEILELDTDALREISREHPSVPRIINAFYQHRLNSPEEQRART